MMEPHKFAAKVEAFLSETGTPPTRFGKNAVGDPCFVFDLRRGREPGYRTARRVLDYIDRAKTPSPERTPSSGAEP